MQQVSMYVVVQGCRLKHFDSESEAFLDKVSMTSRLPHLDCQKRFPMYQPGSMYEVADYGRGSASHKDLEQLPVDCKSIFHLQNSVESLIQLIFLQLLYL